MKTVKYKRHEFLHKPLHVEGTLLTLVYDIPYFAACGIFPSLHIINQILSSGGNGGMSPGASWKPFTLVQEEYDELVVAVKETPISEIEPFARYAHLPFKLDSSFDQIADRFEWIKAVCEKHRDNWHSKLRKAGKLVG